MAGRLAELGIDDEMMRRRLYFLRARAGAADTQVVSSPDRAHAALSRACAATLRRDAAVIELLLGDVRKGKAELFSAGVDWLHLGLFHGAFLLRLGDEGRAKAHDMTAWIEEAASDPESIEWGGHDTKRPLARDAMVNPRQLLSLIQAGVGKNSEPTLARTLAREHLVAYHGRPLGVMGVTVGRYVSVLDELCDGKLGNRAHETLMGIAIRRRELIEVARQDGFHWRRLQRPAELVDFDLLALALAAYVGGPDVAEEAFRIMGERGIAASLPFHLARELETNEPRPDDMG